MKRVAVMDIDSDISRIKKRKNNPTLKLEQSSPVNSLGDLIKLGTSIKFYTNLDMIMLWRIVPYLKELEGMIGMSSLKETVFYQVIYYLKGMHTRNHNDEYLHTVIMGPPGSGKTTVAKIIGKIYQAMGILSDDGPFKVAHREDFVAEYMGQTAIKTKKLLTSCLGGVLFVDEVYSLSSGRKDRDSFSQEALDTITSFLDTHKNDFCFIAAGYEDEIYKRFFHMNEGLDRRFPHKHTIEEYNANDLCKIFKKKILEMNWCISVDDSYITNVIKENKELFKCAGGDIETFIGKTKMMHSKRVFNLGQEHRFIFIEEDIKNTVSYIKERTKKNLDDKPPIGMYI